jgi:hypothetical protein
VAAEDEIYVRPLSLIVDHPFTAADAPPQASRVERSYIFRRKCGEQGNPG